MPFWGREDHLREAVESVLAQDDDQWRLTVIDDAYPDEGPGQWVASLTDPRVAYVRHATQRGVSANFNYCVQNATADDLVIMGCDDVMLPSYVGSMRRLRESYPEAAMLLGGVDVIDDESRPIRPVADAIKARLRPDAPAGSEACGEALAVSLMRGNWAYFPAVVWDRKRLAAVGFDAGDTVVQDLRVMMDLIFENASFGLSDDVVFRYRRHKSSVSSVLSVDGARFAEERRLYASVAERAEAIGWRHAKRAARVRMVSRIHALATTPRAIAARDASGFRSLMKHAFGGSSAA